MDTMNTHKPVAPRPNVLMLGAAVSVILASAVGIGAITGVIPSAMSQKADNASASADQAASGSTSRPNRLASSANCANCGTVDAIRSIELRGDASGVGAVAGGLTGAVVGNQMGRGNGNTAMTILGAAGGAFAGNEIEKNMKKHYTYRVTVRMDDGSFRTVSSSAPPAVSIGDKVRVVNGAVVART